MQFSSALQKQATDMFSSSVPISPIPLHTSLSSKNDRNLKRYLRSKAWRDRQREIVRPVPASRSSRNSRSTFIKYLQDYKKGKFQSANDIIIPNSKEGGVINSKSASIQSDVPSSIILNPFSNLPFHENTDTPSTSVKSGVIFTFNSPQVRYLPLHKPPKPLLSSSISKSLPQSILLRDVCIPAFPQHSFRVIKLFNSSSFTAKGCVIPKPNNTASLLDIRNKIRAKDTPLSLSEYFYCSLFQCGLTSKMLFPVWSYFSFRYILSKLLF